VFATAGLIILAFLGIESALQPSGEVRNPERTVPRAALLAMGGVVVLYVSVQLVAQGILGSSLEAKGVTPLATAAGAAYGPVARTIMLAAAAASMFGNLSGAFWRARGRSLRWGATAFCLACWPRCTRSVTRRTSPSWPMPWWGWRSA
jgi:amino acid transporter